MKKRKRINADSGFTLVEIMIVVVIVGILSAIIGPDLFSRVSDSKITAAENQISIFSLALDNYRLDTGSYPTTEQGLEALIKAPTSTNNWRGPYLDKKEVPKDPWGNDYQYKCPGSHNTHKFDLWSHGSDGREGGTGEDADVANW